MKIVVLAGGLSPERNVSCSTGVLVCQALRERGHSVAYLDMFFGTEAYPADTKDFFAAPLDIQVKQVGVQAPNLQAVRQARLNTSPSLFGTGVLDLCKEADMVFLALHGACGEDGRVQATFDLLGIPYTGAGYLGSALAMDKDYTKRLMQGTTVKTPQWSLIEVDESNRHSIMKRIPVPSVIKVLRSGSSLGVSIVKNRADLQKALADCLQYDTTLMIEQYIEGREFTCGVLEGEALPSVEIIPQVEFYDYKSKYQPGATVEVCPADISAELEARIRATALTVHKTLGLSVYSRSDFMVDAEENIYFLEVNTLPGMTPTSLVPQEAAAIGMDYASLCERIIEASVRARAL